MNGSSHAGARNGQKAVSAEQARVSTVVPKPATVTGDYDPSSGECALCWKVHRPYVECEETRRIWELFDRLKLHCLRDRSHPGAVVCKDCCIARLGGHKCQWWDLCWNI